MCRALQTTGITTVTLMFSRYTLTVIITRFIQQNITTVSIRQNWSGGLLKWLTIGRTFLFGLATCIVFLKQTIVPCDVEALFSTELNNVPTPKPTLVPETLLFFLIKTNNDERQPRILYISMNHLVVFIKNTCTKVSFNFWPQFLNQSRFKVSDSCSAPLEKDWRWVNQQNGDDNEQAS